MPIPNLPFPPCIIGRTISTMASALSNFPLFSPFSGSSSLDLLVAAASAANQPKVTPTPAAPCPSHSPHSWHLQPSSVPSTQSSEGNPLLISSRCLRSQLSMMNSLRPLVAHLPPITEISQWIKRFSLMAAVLCTRFQDKALELWAYQATIVRAEHNEAFTGRARSTNRCTFCLQDDHTANHCPHNPNLQVFGWFPDMTSWPTVSPAANPPFLSLLPHMRFAATTMMGNASRCYVSIVMPAAAVN